MASAASPAHPVRALKADRADAPASFYAAGPPASFTERLAAVDAIPLPNPRPVAEDAPAAIPEGLERHRRGTRGSSLCGRHGMHVVWYDNGRRWHCRR
jgi:hypothetical protein